MYNVAIIGAGPAGIFTALEITKLRPEWKVQHPTKEEIDFAKLEFKVWCGKDFMELSSKCFSSQKNTNLLIFTLYTVNISAFLI